jgi:broad specificity phosphatase PhoE
VSTLYLIRHGQASYGVANYDVLSPLGVRQARRIGVALAHVHHPELDAIYSGPLRRQRETAQHLREAAAEAGRALPEPTIVEELSEYPAFELLRTWLPRLVDEDPSFRALAGEGAERPDAIALLDRAFETIIGRWASGSLEDNNAIESFAAFGDRVKRAIEAVTRGHAGGRVAAVTSGGVIAVAMRLALGFDDRRTMALGRLIRNASVSEFLWRSRGFAWGPEDFSVVGFNHVHHLDHGEVTFR